MGLMEAGWLVAMRRMFGDTPDHPAWKSGPWRQPIAQSRTARSGRSPAYPFGSNDLLGGNPVITGDRLSSALAASTAIMRESVGSDRNSGFRRARIASNGPLALALEPRYLFDGAAAASIVDAAHPADAAHPPSAPDPLAKALADHVLPADPTAGVSAPTRLRAADPAQTNGRKEVAFVDTSSPGYQELAEGIRAGVEVEVIDGGQSGLAQIAKWAESHTGYDAIHLLSHGSAATLNLGTDRISNDSLGTALQQVEMAEIGHALNAGGDLLLYGCDVAKGDDGQKFITDLAAATGADVAASDNITGMDGNWILEKATGSVVAGQLDTAVLANFTHDLTAPSAFQIVVENPSSSSPGIYLYDTTTDAQHNIYVVGSFSRSVTFTINGQATTFARLGSSKTSGFVAEYDASGACLMAKVVGEYVDSTTNVNATAIALDSGGNIILGGNFFGTADFDPGAGTQNKSAAGTASDIFVEKLDSSGNFVWVKTYGSSDATANDSLKGLAVAGTQIAFGGNFGRNSNNSINFGGTTLTSPGTAGYVVSLDSTGATQWAYKYDDSGNSYTEEVNSIGSSLFQVGSLSSSRPAIR